MRTRILILSTGTALLAAAASSCSSASKASTSPAAASLSSPSSSSPSKSTAISVAGNGKLDGVPKACPSAAKVMSNLHLSNLVLSGDDPSTCTYLRNGAKSSPAVLITFTAAPGVTASTIESGLKGGQSDVVAVAGLADAAFTFTGADGVAGLTFLSGSTVCSIASTVATTTAGKTALARSIIRG